MTVGRDTQSEAFSLRLGLTKGTDRLRLRIWDPGAETGPGPELGT